MANTLTLLCLVHGETSDNAFPVDISKNATVGHLKDAIKVKKQHAFADIDADKLSLWRLSIPADDDAMLQNLVLANDQDKGILKLHPAKEIGDVFPERPKKEHVHIIISPPASAGGL